MAKPDIAANPIYPLIARAALAELHANLLDLIEQALLPRRSRNNIVVVGPGSEVLPYSGDLDRIWRLLNGGNLILLDYNADICAGIPAYLEQLGATDRFDVQLLEGSGLIEPEACSDSILIKQWNIRDGFPFATASVDVIDMTVSMHHVTQYEADIVSLFKHAHKVLKPGAILHLGEGAVDMKYSERKIKRLAGDVIRCGLAGVTIADARYSDAPPRRWSVGAEDVEALINLTEEGMVEIRSPATATIAAGLRSLGYKQLFVGEQALVLPLIDPSMEADFQEMIVPVREYYAAISELALPRLDSQYHAAFQEALGKERSDAMRGVVEYYSAPEMLRDALLASRFRIDQFRTASAAFVNIIATKS